MKEQIVVVGMGGLFPGPKTIDEFWDKLLENKRLIIQSINEAFEKTPIVK